MLARERYGRLIVVLGMQFGSEGKGAIVNYLSPIVDVAVRTGASNAGHTIYFNGESYVMRQIPSSWTNPLTKLVIGAGAMISLDVLSREIEFYDSLIPLKNRLFVDNKAHVITEEQVSQEAQSDLAMRIGSTSARSREGIGQATADKVLRKADCLLAQNCSLLKPYLADTADIINSTLEGDGHVLIEGTQGHGLSLDHGHFPYTTSRDVSVGALAASAGIALHEFPVDIIGVTRTYPIRVAGNSGPFGGDAQELTWDEITQRCKADRPIIEQTTVTKATRRVSEFSWDEFKKACRINRPTEIAVTFADYLDWSVHGEVQTTPTIDIFVSRVEEVAEAPVTLIKTGPVATIDYDYYRNNIIRRIQ